MSKDDRLRLIVDRLPDQGDKRFAGALWPGAAADVGDRKQASEVVGDLWMTSAGSCGRRLNFRVAAQWRRYL